MRSFDHVLASASGQELVTIGWLGKGIYRDEEGTFSDAFALLKQAMLLSPAVQRV